MHKILLDYEFKMSFMSELLFREKRYYDNVKYNKNGNSSSIYEILYYCMHNVYLQTNMNVLYRKFTKKLIKALRNVGF